MNTDTYRRVHADLRAREQKGIQTYGSALRSDTPVDLLTYAYEEALDKAVYLRAEIDKRDEMLAAALAAVAELERRVAEYDTGDRPMSPPAALLAETFAAQKHLGALKRLIGK